MAEAANPKTTQSGSEMTIPCSPSISSKNWESGPGACSFPASCSRTGNSVWPRPSLTFQHVSLAQPGPAWPGAQRLL